MGKGNELFMGAAIGAAIGAGVMYYVEEKKLNKEQEKHKKLVIKLKKDVESATQLSKDLEYKLANTPQVVTKEVPVTVEKKVEVKKMDRDLEDAKKKEVADRMLNAATFDAYRFLAERDSDDAEEFVRVLHSASKGIILASSIKDVKKKAKKADDALLVFGRKYEDEIRGLGDDSGEYEDPMQSQRYIDEEDDGYEYNDNEPGTILDIVPVDTDELSDLRDMIAEGEGDVDLEEEPQEEPRKQQKYRRRKKRKVRKEEEPIQKIELRKTFSTPIEERMQYHINPEVLDELGGQIRNTTPIEEMADSAKEFAEGGATEETVVTLEEVEAEDNISEEEMYSGADEVVNEKYREDFYYPYCNALRMDQHPSKFKLIFILNKLDSVESVTKNHVLKRLNQLMVDIMSGNPSVNIFDDINEIFDALKVS